jgi:hypothetical protein
MSIYLIYGTTAALNLLAAWWNSAAEKKLEETSPRFKACVDVVAALGIDPEKLFSSIATLVKKK